MNELKLNIARELAREAFNESGSENGSGPATTTLGASGKRKELSEIQAERLARSARAIAEPQTNQLYSAAIERQMVTRVKMEQVVPSLTALGKDDRCSMHTLAVRTVRSFQDALFGCDVKLGIGVDAGCSSIDFLGQDYKKRVHRGKSSCFECIDQLDVVVQVPISQSRADPSDQDETATPQVTEGETVVYVPLLGGNGRIAVGLLEIHGLVLERVTDFSKYERSDGVIRTMLENKDYKFMKYTKFWRRPTDRSGGVIPKKLMKKNEKYNHGCYPVVCGKCVEANETLNGNPYFGGARFTVEWEDGLREEAIPPQDFVQLFRNTPPSLGCTTELTDELAEQFLDMGKKIGHIMEHKRRLETLKKLKKDYSKSGLRPDDICSLACTALIATIRGLKEASFIGAFCPDEASGASTELKREDNLKDDSDKPKKPSVLPRLDFSAAEQLVKKAPNGKSVSRSGTMSYGGIAGLVVDVDRGYESAPKRDKKRDICAAGESPKKKTDVMSKYHREQAIIERSAADRPLGGSSAVINIPDGPIQEWVSSELWLPKEFVFSHSKAQYSSHIFGLVLRTANVTTASAAEDNGCFQDIMNICSDALVTCWKKDLRKKARKQVVVELEAKIPELKDLDQTDLINYVLNTMGRVAPGVSMYVGVLQKGGYDLLYEGSNKLSRMKGQRLLRGRGQGVSFDVIDSQEPLVISLEEAQRNRRLTVGDMVDCVYGRRVYRAHIVKCWGHEIYDVRYMESSGADGELEVGVPMARITPIAAAFRMKKFGHFGDPFVCIPLSHRDKPVGVIGMDGFDAVEKAPYDVQPEVGLLEYFKHVGRILGTLIDKKKKKLSMQNVAKIARNINATFSEIFDAVFDAIQDNLRYCGDMLVCQIQYENHVSKSDHGAKLLFSRGKPERISEMMGYISTYHPSRSNQKSVQKKGDLGQLVWLLCKTRAAEKGGQGPIHIISLSQDRSIPEPDLEYLESLQKLVAAMIQNSITRKKRSQIRSEALSSIQKMCSQWSHQQIYGNVDYSLYPDRFVSMEALFLDICDAISTCYPSANVYVGKLSANCTHIDYILASKHSKMKGKKLVKYSNKRKGPAVSFSSAEDMKRVYISEGTSDASQLQFFGKKELFEFPFVCVPVAAFEDAAMGVLSVDGCEELSTGGSDGEGNSGDSESMAILEFFYSVATLFSDPLRLYCLSLFKRELRHIERNAPNYLTGIQRIKEVMLGTLPFATHVAEVLIEPVLIHKVLELDSGAGLSPDRNIITAAGNSTPPILPKKNNNGSNKRGLSDSLGPPIDAIADSASPFKKQKTALDEEIVLMFRILYLEAVGPKGTIINNMYASIRHNDSLVSSFDPKKMFDLQAKASEDNIVKQSLNTFNTMFKGEDKSRSSESHAQSKQAFNLSLKNGLCKIVIPAGTEMNKVKIDIIVHGKRIVPGAANRPKTRDRLTAANEIGDEDSEYNENNIDECGRLSLSVNYFCNTPTVIMEHLVPLTGHGTSSQSNSSHLRRGYADIYSSKLSIISKVWSKDEMIAYQLIKLQGTGLATVGPTGAPVEPFAILKLGGKIIFQSDPYRPPKNDKEKLESNRNKHSDTSRKVEAEWNIKHDSTRLQIPQSLLDAENNSKTLKIELFDSDLLLGRGVFLGSCSISSRELVEICTSEKALFLAPLPGSKPLKTRTGEHVARKGVSSGDINRAVQFKGVSSPERGGAVSSRSGVPQFSSSNGGWHELTDIKGSTNNDTGEQSYVQGMIALNGYSYVLDDGALYNEIDTIFKALSAENGQSVSSAKLKSGKKKGATAGVAKSQTCEFHVLRARNLYVVNPSDLSGALGQTSGIENPFAVILFNGVEIGKTATIKNTTSDPVWEEEYFTIYIPLAVGSEAMNGVLTVELHEMNAFGRSQRVSSVTIMGKDLISLLVGREMKQAWFDLEACLPASITDSLDSETRNIPSYKHGITSGEILLSGRPMDVEVSGFEPPPIEPMEVQFNVIAVSGLPVQQGKALDGVGLGESIYVTMDWNGRRVYDSAQSPVTAQYAVDEIFGCCLFGGSALAFNAGASSHKHTQEDARVVISLPNSKPLNKCMLIIKVWNRACYAAQGSSYPIAFGVLEKEQLVDIIQSRGNFCSEVWINLSPTTRAFKGDDIFAGSVLANTFCPGKMQCKLRGGLMNAPDIPRQLDEDTIRHNRANNLGGEEYILEVFAGTSIPKLRSVFASSNKNRDTNTNPDVAPNVYAVLYFNDVEIGMSNTCTRTTDPVWANQKFTVQFPMIDPLFVSMYPPGSVEIDAFSSAINRLRVEIWHKEEFQSRYNSTRSRQTMDQFLGFFELVGDDLTNFVDEMIATKRSFSTRWFNIDTVSPPASCMRYLHKDVAEVNAAAADQVVAPQLYPRNRVVPGFKTPMVKVRMGPKYPDSIASTKQVGNVPCLSMEYMVEVLFARGLANTDPFGKSNPFVIVYLNGDEVGRTRVQTDSLDPVWTPDLPPRRLLGDAKRGSRPGAALDGNDTTKTRDINKEGKKEMEEFMLILPADIMLEDNILTLEVYDWKLSDLIGGGSVGSSGDFLGEVRLTGEDLANLICSEKSSHSIAKEYTVAGEQILSLDDVEEAMPFFTRGGEIAEFELQPNVNISDEQNQFAQGILGLRGAPIITPAVLDDKMAYEYAGLKINAASGLAKLNLLGKLDPVCLVYWMCSRLDAGVEKMIGTSRIVRNSHSPTWKDKPFKVLVPREEWGERKRKKHVAGKSLAAVDPVDGGVADTIADDVLDDWASVQVRIEIWDSLADGQSRGAFLGSVSLSGLPLRDLVRRRTVDCLDVVMYALSTTPSLPEVQQKYVQGDLLLSGGTLPALGRWLSASSDTVANARYLLETEGHDGTASDDSDLENGLNVENSFEDSQDFHHNSFAVNQELDSTENAVGAENCSETHEDTVETPFVLKLSVKKATGLPKPPIFGSVHTFVSIKWNPRNSVSESPQNENIDEVAENATYSSQPVKGGTDVEWGDIFSNTFLLNGSYNERMSCILEEYDEDEDEDGLIAEEMQHKKLSRQLDGCSLEVQLYNQSTFGEAVQIGSAVIDNDNLVELCYQANPSWFELKLDDGSVSDPMQLCLVGRVDDADRDASISQKLSSRLEAESIPYNPNIAGVKKRVLSLLVISAQGLPAGKSSLKTKLPAVCVTVIFNGTLIGKTNVAAKSLDPRWDELRNEDFLSLVVPVVFPELETHQLTQHDLENKSNSGSQAAFRQGLHAPLDPLGTNSMRNHDSRPSSVKRGVLLSDILTFQVWDASQGNKLQNGCEGTLLGAVDLRGNDLADLISLHTGGSRRTTVQVHKVKTVSTATRTLFSKRTSKPVADEFGETVGKLEVVLCDNCDSINDVEAGKIIHTTLARRRGPSIGYPMVTVKQHRPVNRETDLIVKVQCARNFAVGVNDKTTRNLYYMVWLNDRLIGRSSIARETLSPKWDGASDFFILPYDQIRMIQSKEGRGSAAQGRNRTRTASVCNSFGAKFAHAKLQIEVWDQLSSGTKVFVGVAVISGDLYDQFDSKISASNNATAAADDTGDALTPSSKWVSLQRSEVIPPHLQSHIGGELNITLTPPDSMSTADNGAEAVELIPEGLPVAFEITICSAENLSRADTFGLSDPFCIVKFDGAEIGRTSVLHKTTNPVWSGERFVVSMNLPESSDLRAGANYTIPGDVSLQVEVWDMDTTGVGEFLGCVRLTDRTLNDFLGTTSLARAGKKTSNSKPKTFSLHKSAALPEEKQKLVKGKLTMLAKDVTKRINKRQRTADGKGFVIDDEEEEVAHSYLDAVTQSSGDPHITIQVLRCTGLANASSNRAPEALCRVIWDGGVVGLTDTLPQSADPVWSVDNPIDRTASNDGGGCFFRIALSRRAEMLSSSNLILEVCDGGNILSEVPLGSVNISFWSLMRVHGGGAVTLPLKPKDYASPTIGAKEDNSGNGILAKFANNIKTGLKEVGGAVRELVTTDFRVTGTISFKVNFCFPVWESTVPKVPASFSRRVTVASAKDLPEINNQLPSCKVVILYDGIIVGKSMVIPSSSFPVWPETQCDLVVGFNSSASVVIQIVHVDLDNRRDICLGETTISAEILLRPPSEEWEGHLMPPERAPPKKYKFILDGSVRVSVTMNADERSSSTIPWASKLIAPYYAYDVKDVCQYNYASVSRATRSRGQMVTPDQVSRGPPPSSAEHDRLTEPELRWLGSSSNYSVPQVVGGRPEWIIVPVRDAGALVGDRIVGTPPGIRYALCMKRPPERLNSSDILRVLELHSSLEQAVGYLRKREIFKELRRCAFLKLKDVLENMSKRADLDLQLMFRKLATTLMQCIPGAQIHTAVLNVDFNSITYTLFNSGRDSASAVGEEDTNVRTSTLWLGQGCDWTSVGRKAVMTSLKTLSDVENNGKKFASFKPFTHCSFPRYTVPLQAGDVSLGLFGVENLDIYQAGIDTDFESNRASGPVVNTDNDAKIGDETKTYLDLLSNPFGTTREMKELKEWLQATAGMCGDVMYAARERHAINELELYCQLATSTPTGLMRRMLNACLSVLQGCRMIELWAVREITRTQRPPVVSRNTTVTPNRETVRKTKSIKSVDESDSEEGSETGDAEEKHDSARAVVTFADDVPRVSEHIPTYDPTVDSPTEFHITSLAVQTPRPPPVPGRMLKLHDIKVIYDPVKKQERKKLMVSMSEKDSFEVAPKAEESPQKNAVGLGTTLKQRINGIANFAKAPELQSVYESEVGGDSMSEIDESEHDGGVYASNNSVSNKIPTKYLLGIDYGGVEQCCLLTCAADIPETEVTDSEDKNTTNPVSKPSRKIQSRSAMLSAKTSVTAVKTVKAPKKNAYLVTSGKSKANDLQLKITSEHRRKEYKRKQERQKLLKHTYLGEDTSVVLGSDRDFVLVVYEVTEDMKVVNEFRGLVQLVTFKEASFKCKLTPARDTTDETTPAGFFLLTMDVSWLLRAESDGGHSGKMGSDLAWKNKVCTLRLSGGGNMKKTDVLGSADPFCEVFLNGNFVARTSVQKDTLNPQWEAEIVLPAFSSHKDSCTIEVYDMNRLGKGSFMGQVELTMDQLLYPPVKDIRVPLAMKPDLPTKKQLYVGGYLSLRYSLGTPGTVSTSRAEKAATVGGNSDDPDDAKRTKGPFRLSNGSKETDVALIQPTTPKENLTSVPAAILSMKSPRLRLSICRASNLPRTGNFIGSQPSTFVKIFCTDERQNLKGKKGKASVRNTSTGAPINQTTVISTSAHPVWNETFEVNIESGMSAFSSLTHVEKAQLLREYALETGEDKESGIQFIDFVTLRFEVWDSSDEFLGMVELPAREYMSYLFSEAIVSTDMADQYEVTPFGADTNARDEQQCIISKKLRTSPNLDKKKNRFVNGSAVLSVQCELYEGFQTSQISAVGIVSSVGVAGPEGMEADFEEIAQSIATQPNYFGTIEATKERTDFLFNKEGGLLWNWKVEVLILKAQDLIVVNNKGGTDSKHPSSKSGGKRKGFNFGWKNSTKWGKPNSKSDPYCVLHWVTSRYVPDAVDPVDKDPKAVFAAKYAPPTDRPHSLMTPKVRMKKVTVTDKILGQTACKRNTTNPYWSGERFLLDLSKLLHDMDISSVRGKSADVVHELVIEVWSLPPVTSSSMFSAGISRPLYEENVAHLLQHDEVGVFLGEIRLDLCNLLHPSSEVKEEKLKPKKENDHNISDHLSQNMRSTSYKLDRDAALTADFVGGKLTYKLHQICQPFSVALPRKRHLYGVDVTKFGTPARNPLAGEGDADSGPAVQRKDENITTSSDAFKKNQFQSNFSVESSSLEVVMDPEAEEDRQIYEGMELPGLLRAAREKHESYLSNPFRRIGLISELHYGQVSSAISRSQSTVLKTPKLDMHVIPTVKVLSNAVRFDRNIDGDFARMPKNISDEKMSLKLPAKSSKVAPNMIVALDTGHSTEKKSSDNAKKDTMLCLVSRYESNKLPRRDVQFLDAARKVIIRGINMMESRSDRLRRRFRLLSDLQGMLVPGRQRFELDEVVMQLVHMLESTFELGVTLYLVKPVHEKKNGPNKTATFNRSLFRCSNSSGEVSTQSAYDEQSSDESGGDRNATLLRVSSKLCRHGYLLQAYRGYHSLAGYDWTQYGDYQDKDEPMLSDSKNDTFSEQHENHDTMIMHRAAGLVAGVANIEACARGDRARALSQTCLVPILDASHVLDSLEPDCEGIQGPATTDSANGTKLMNSSICNLISQTAKKECAMGNYVVPLIAFDAMCVGMVVLSGADKIPHSIYETLISKAGQSIINGSDHSDISTVQNKSSSADSDKWDKVFQEEPEEGVASTLVASGKLMGAVLAQAAVDMALKEMKMYVIREETPLMDVIRFCFRCIANAIPAITGLAIWSVDCVSGRHTEVLTIKGSDMESGTAENDSSTFPAPMGPIKEESTDETPLVEIHSSTITDFADVVNKKCKQHCTLTAGYFGVQDAIDVVVSSPDERIVDRLSSNSSAANPAVKSARKTLVGVISEKEKERQRLRRSMAHIAGANGEDVLGPIKGTVADRIYEANCPWLLSPPGFILSSRTAINSSAHPPSEPTVNESLQRLLRDEILKCLQQEHSCFRVSSGHDLFHLMSDKSTGKRKKENSASTAKNTTMPKKEAVEDNQKPQESLITPSELTILYDIFDDMFGVPRSMRLTPRTKEKVKSISAETTKSVATDQNTATSTESKPIALKPTEPAQPSQDKITVKPPPPAPPPKNKKPGMATARSTMRKNREQLKKSSVASASPAVIENTSLERSNVAEVREKENRRHAYFLAVSTIGVGGNKGWGSLGNLSSSSGGLITQLSDRLQMNILKWAGLRAKVIN